MLDHLKSLFRKHWLPLLIALATFLFYLTMIRWDVPVHGGDQLLHRLLSLEVFTESAFAPHIVTVRKFKPTTTGKR